MKNALRAVLGLTLVLAVIAVGVVSLSLGKIVKTAVEAAHLIQAALTAGVEITSTGTPLSTEVPESGSSTELSSRLLTLTPAWVAATESRVPGASCPHPCGSETTPGRIASVPSGCGAA